MRWIEWLKLNFASCVVPQTSSLGVLILFFMYNMVLCTKPTIWLILSFTIFTEGRSRVFYVCRGPYMSSSIRVNTYRVHSSGKAFCCIYGVAGGGMHSSTKYGAQLFNFVHMYIIPPLVLVSQVIFHAK